MGLAGAFTTTRTPIHCTYGVQRSVRSTADAHAHLRLRMVSPVSTRACAVSQVCASIASRLPEKSSDNRLPRKQPNWRVPSAFAAEIAPPAVMRSVAFFAWRGSRCAVATNPEDDVLHGRQQDDAAPQHKASIHVAGIFTTAVKRRCV